MIVKKELIEKIEKELYRDESKGDEFLSYEDIDSILKSNLGEDIEWGIVLNDDFCDMDWDWKIDFEELRDKIEKRIDEDYVIDDVNIIKIKGVGEYCGYDGDIEIKLLVYSFGKLNKVL